MGTRKIDLNKFKNVLNNESGSNTKKALIGAVKSPYTIPKAVVTTVADRPVGSIGVALASAIGSSQLESTGAFSAISSAIEAINLVSSFFGS